MWNYLRNLQNKPLHTRKMILYVSTIVSFFIVVLLWILLLNIQKVNESKASLEDSFSPFERIKEVFTNMFEKINTTNIPAIPTIVNENEVINSPNIIQSTTSSMGTNMATTTTENATGTRL